jgi:hypothetical protein
MTTTGSYLDGYARMRERDIRMAAEAALITEERPQPPQRRSFLRLLGTGLVEMGLYLLRNAPADPRSAARPERRQAA